MLLNLKLNCFRKHVSLETSFAGGLTVIRAPSEGGKSTLIEGALYATFGSKALRNTLADTVTWGRKESELKVTATWRVEGKLYCFTRSKSGAECAHEGGIVVGQTEVSNFASTLFGCDATTANKLMLANQGNLRGALEEGPKALSQQIETLANFSLFDTLIERAQAKLLLGPTTTNEARVAEAMEGLSGEVPVKPDLTAMIERKSELMDREEMDSIAVQGPLQVALTKAMTDLMGAANTVKQQAALEGNIEAAMVARLQRQTQRDEASGMASVHIDPNLIPNLTQQILDAGNHAANLALYRKVSDLMLHYPATNWEGTREDFQSELEKTTTKHYEVQQEIKHHEQIKETCARETVRNFTCPTCKQAISDVQHIHAENSRRAEESAAAEKACGPLRAQLKELAEYLTDLKTVRASAATFDAALQTFGTCPDVTIDWNNYPPKFNWTAAVPSATGADVSALKQQRSQAEGALVERQKATARVAILNETLMEDNATIDRLQTQLTEFPIVTNLKELQDAVDAVGAKQNVLRQAIAGYQAEVRDIDSKIQTAEFEYKNAVEKRAAAQAKLDKERLELDTLIFNNALLKKIRLIRPQVADKLWNTVLASVSNMFSQMRGDMTVITKEKDGFKANGQSVESLSGSTLDLLAIAIRVALLKTFLPHADFLMLDEPCHGMDSDRTLKFYSFLSTCGFDQSIVVTHEAVSESFSNQLITL